MVLKEFDAGAVEATALAKQRQEPPAMFDSPYKGVQVENGGVVGMLEVSSRTSLAWSRKPKRPRLLEGSGALR